MICFGVTLEMPEIEKKKYIVASVGEWNKVNFDNNVSNLPGEWFYAESPELLVELLENISPRYIFFPHWRWIVPRAILENFECVCFHMTDVPYGRGGTPLQNLILTGHKDTVLTALRMEEELDAGPVYIKKPLNLDGNAEEIYKRASLLTWDIIEVILIKEPTPKPQVGEPVYFTRRKPIDSILSENLDMEQMYDQIRMLDAPNYPKAYIEFGDYQMEFYDADLTKNGLTAKVKIRKKPEAYDY